MCGIPSCGPNKASSGESEHSSGAHVDEVTMTYLRGSVFMDDGLVGWNGRDGWSLGGGGSLLLWDGILLEANDQLRTREASRLTFPVFFLLIIMIMYESHWLFLLAEAQSMVHTCL